MSQRQPTEQPNANVPRRAPNTQRRSGAFTEYAETGQEALAFPTTGTGTRGTVWDPNDVDMDSWVSLRRLAETQNH